MSNVHETEGRAPLALTNGGELELTFIGSGSAFSKVFYQNNLLIVKGDSHLLVDCGTRAPEALARLGEEARYDALVSGMNLPDMDGFALAAAVRGDPRSRDLPIIALATDRDRDSVERGRAVGFTDCVAKFDRNGLIAALREFTGRQHGVAA